MSMQKVNNRTVVHWAVKMDIIGEGEESLKDIDSAVNQVPPTFIRSLEELVAEDTYLRFGDFASKFYAERPEALAKLGIELADIKKGFDKIAANQRSGDRSIGELAADAGIIFREDIAAIEDTRYNYYNSQKPLKLILKERYDNLMRRRMSLRLRVICAVLLIVLGAAYFVMLR